MLKQLKIEKRSVIRLVIVLAAAFIIANLISKCSYGENYHMFTKVEVYEEQGALRTPYYRFPAGNYHVIVNYVCDEKIIAAIHNGNRVLLSTQLEADTDCGYGVFDFTLNEEAGEFYIAFENAMDHEFSVYNMEVLSDRALNQDHFWYGVVFFVICLYAAVLLFLSENGKIAGTQAVTAVLLMVFALFASLPLMLDYLIYAHDLAFQVGRIEGVKEALLDGQLIPVVFPGANHGYGYLGFLYPEFFLIFPAILRILGASMVASYQLLLMAVNFGTIIIAYFACRIVFRSELGKDLRKAALLGAIVYTLSPYRLCDMYIRGALGETLAMMFLPLVLAGCYQIAVGNQRDWPLLVIGMTGILQSHILSVVMILPVLLIGALCFAKELFGGKRWLSLLYAAIATAVANAWYLIPFAGVSRYPLRLNEIARDNYDEYALFPGQLFMTRVSTFVHQVKADGISEETFSSIGIIGAIGLGILLLFLYEAALRKQRTQFERFILFLGGTAVLYLFVASTLFPHKWLSQISLVSFVFQRIQFLVRFLAIVSVCLMFVTGAGVFKLESILKWKEPLFCAFIVISILQAGIIMDAHTKECAAVYTYSGGFLQAFPIDYLPQNADTGIELNQDIQITSGRVTEYEHAGGKISLAYSAQEETKITLPLYYYPGYRAYNEASERLEVTADESGKLVITAPADSDGKINVKVSYFYLVDFL